MKLPSKFLFVALLAALAFPAVAQKAKLSPAPPTCTLDVVSGSLVVVETDQGWSLRFTDMGPSEVVGIVFGKGAGGDSIDLGVYGSVDVQVNEVMFWVFAGMTSPTGELAIFLPRPASLPPELEGVQFTIQAVSLDVRNPSKDKGVKGLTTSNVCTFTLKSAGS